MSNRGNTTVLELGNWLAALQIQGTKILLSLFSSSLFDFSYTLVSRLEPLIIGSGGGHVVLNASSGPSVSKRKVATNSKAIY
jgi:hypothetical protein